MGYNGYPDYYGFTVISDPNISVCHHGGFAWYIKDSIYGNVFNVTFKSSFIAFSLDMFPHVVFIGAYVKPENSNYFDPLMFSEICSFIVECHNSHKIVFIGGDFNCRVGNLNSMMRNNLWKYDQNVDTITNSHGRIYFPALCDTAKIMPINHLNYKRRKFMGDYTYQKQDRKSQIDFVLTDKTGRDFINDFCIIQNDWFLSDHKPLCLKLSLPLLIPAISLYKRSIDLNFEISKQSPSIIRFKGIYNYNKIRRNLESQRSSLTPLIDGFIFDNNIESALKSIDNMLQIAHKEPGCRLKIKKENNSLDLFDKVNNSYSNYKKIMGDNSSTDNDRENALNAYLRDRKAIHYELLKKECDYWSSIVSNNDARSLWSKIDWNGNYSRKKPSQHPSINEFQTFFEDLYTCKDKDELVNIDNLRSDVNIPVLDDPIIETEVEDALKSMKNGGFDYNLPILFILFSCFKNTILLLLNFIFFVKYPIYLALSLLSIIPKKGNLLLPKNYRGIQMLRAIGSLYDRIIAKRLYKWMHVENEQSAFQKGKSTILQIFTLRLLIEIANKKNITLYIACVDLEKAFDKVSRYRLLSKLVLRGIGSVMLEALKNIYLHTTCIINLYGCFSDSFITMSGIRQGSASSVLLFILFMDGLFPFLRLHCSKEQLINDFHALVHADDTIIISTSKSKFVSKCNCMIDYFETNKLSLNLEKSSYFIINAGVNDHKVSLELNKGYLNYKAYQKYLGITLTDSGSMKSDIAKFITQKRSEILIKYTNFCNKNFFAPLSVKLQILDTCVASSLIYAAETWSNYGDEVEVIYRSGIRIALGVRTNVNNEIIYVETNRYPLKCRISKLQWKFWANINTYISNHPESMLKHLIEIALDLNLPYTQHYIDLHTRYSSSNECLKSQQNRLMDNWKFLFNNATDVDSRLGTYIRINPNLTTPKYISKTLFETDRQLLSRFRCGSHSLLVEKGRYIMLNYNDRVCSCGTGVQTIIHCFTNCPLITPLLQRNYTNLHEIFEDDDICIMLQTICKVLKLAM